MRGVKDEEGKVEMVEGSMSEFVYSLLDVLVLTSRAGVNCVCKLGEEGNKGELDREQRLRVGGLKDCVRALLVLAVVDAYSELQLYDLVSERDCSCRYNE